MPGQLSLGWTSTEEQIWCLAQGLKDKWMEQGRQRELEKGSFSKEIMQVCQSSVLLKSLRHVCERKMGRDMRFPTMLYVRSATPQISLRIRTV